MKRKIIWLLVSSLMALSLMMASCAPAVEEEVVAGPQGMLTIAVDSLGQDNFDPLVTGTQQKRFLTLLYDSLAGHTIEGKLSEESGIAYKWEMTPDGKTWTFYLREGIMFHNGDELTAEDIKFQLDRVFDPASSSTGISALRAMLDVVEVVDSYTVTVHLKEPNVFLPEILSDLTGNEGMIVSKRAIEEEGIDYLATHPIGTGPYKFKEFVSGIYVLYEAAFDEHFFLGKPKYQYVKFLNIPEEAARIGLLQRGEVDLAVLSRWRLEEAEAAGIRTARDPAALSVFLHIGNVGNPEYPVNDIRVREAISLAIDKEELLEHVWGGMGETSGQYSGLPVALGYKPLSAMPYDPEKARRLLAEAGYPDGFDINMHTFPRPGTPETTASMEVVADYLTKVGIRVNVIVWPDYGTLRPLKVPANEGMKGCIYPGFFPARFYPLSSNRWGFHSDGLGSGTRDPVLDEIIETALTTLSREEAAEKAYQVNLHIRDNFIIIPFFILDGLFGVGEAIPDDWDAGVLGNDYNLEPLVMED